MKRAIYLGAFTVLALIAAGLTLHAQHKISVVVANRDVKIGEQLQAGDIALRDVHDDTVSANAAHSKESVVGQYVTWPLTSGEPILRQSLQNHQSGNELSNTGFSIPSGYQAVSLPVQAATAVGGMLRSGDRVDVYATPLAGHQPTTTNGLNSSDNSNGGNTDTSSGSSLDTSQNAIPLGTRLVGKHALVLELRNDQGQALSSQSNNSDSVHGLNFSSAKLGAVVIAVPNSDVSKYADSAINDSIYLALSIS